MSSDNGIYILKTNDGYRVTEAQAIGNIYWWYTCCNKPNVREVMHDVEGACIITYKCYNCGTNSPNSVRKNKICPDRLREYFGDCTAFLTEQEAFKEAKRIYDEIMNERFNIGFVPIIEYGIQFIEYKGEFPK